LADVRPEVSVMIVQLPAASSAAVPGAVPVAALLAVWLHAALVTGPVLACLNRRSAAEAHWHPTSAPEAAPGVEPEERPARMAAPMVRHRSVDVTA
jgi:hypothetical protein